ncbi:hypothetical protein PQX77_003025 [Marasmius sp. AFHP31]|nr:hypothetical protein PQX77_003025 [Marasmius sp. AFHP31]
MPAEIIKTFSSPKTARRPKVIPLFATTYLSAPRRQLALHQDLPQKPRARPYPHPAMRRRSPTPPPIRVPQRGGVPTGTTSAQSSTTTTNGTTTQRASSTGKAEKDCEPKSCPGSPLTPLPGDKGGAGDEETGDEETEDEEAGDGEAGDGEAGPTRTADPVLICQPRNFTLKKSGWGGPVLASMRAKTRDIIRDSLNDKVSYGDQDPNARQKAIDKLTQSFKELQNHQNDWGAKAVLRDQLKSVKNTKSAFIRRHPSEGAQA